MEQLLEVLEVAEVNPGKYAITYRALADDGEPTVHDGRHEEPLEIPRGEDPGTAIAEWIRAEKIKRARLNLRAVARRSSRGNAPRSLEDPELEADLELTSLAAAAADELDDEDAHAAALELEERDQDSEEVA